MATDLTDLNWENGGNNYKQAGVGEAAAIEIKLSKWAKLVTIQPTAQALLFSYEGTDGVALSTHAFPQAVDSIIQYNPVQTSQDRSIFIQSQSGTAVVYFIFE